jgi:hypothetical protein
MVGTFGQDRLDGRDLTKPYLHAELLESCDSPFDDAVVLLPSSIAHDQPQLSAERSFALEHRDVVAARRRDDCRLEAGGAAADDHDSAPLPGADHRRDAPLRFATDRGILLAREGTPIAIAHETTLSGPDTHAHLGRSPGARFLRQLGSAMLARVIATMSTSPRSMMAWACSGARRGPHRTPGSTARPA